MSDSTKRDPEPKGKAEPEAAADADADAEAEAEAEAEEEAEAMAEDLERLQRDRHGANDSFFPGEGLLNAAEGFESPQSFHSRDD